MFLSWNPRAFNDLPIASALLAVHAHAVHLSSAADSGQASTCVRGEREPQQAIMRRAIRKSRSRCNAPIFRQAAKGCPTGSAAPMATR